jgi:hypothetical protein
MHGTVTRIFKIWILIECNKIERENKSLLPKFYVYFKFIISTWGPFVTQYKMSPKFRRCHVNCNVSYVTVAAASFKGYTTTVVATSLFNVICFSRNSSKNKSNGLRSGGRETKTDMLFSYVRTFISFPAFFPIPALKSCETGAVYLVLIFPIY